MPDPQLLDIEDPRSLVTYLRESGRIASSETPSFRVLAGGVSNKTVLVERESGDAWVLKQALPKLRVKADWFSDPSRIRREAMALRWLPRLAPEGTITPLVFEDAERYVLAMQAVPAPHDNWKSLLLARQVNPDYVRQFAGILSHVHRNAFDQGADVAPLFSDRSFFESLRIEPYYLYTASRVPEARAFLEALVAGTRSRAFTLVHGDYSPKNVLVRNDRLILLDHEVIHWGDPAFDVGFALAHLLSKAHHLLSERNSLRDAAVQFWRDYSEDLGPLPWTGDLEAWAVQHALGCLLARVAGRSPLEYLNEQEQHRQRDAVVGLMVGPKPVKRVSQLVEQFTRQL